VYNKVTTRPDLFGTDTNVDGLSRENYAVFRDAELSGMPNPVPIFSRIECNVTPHVDKVYTYRSNTYIEFVVVRYVLSSSKYTKSIFGAGGAYDAP